MKMQKILLVLGASLICLYSNNASAEEVQAPTYTVKAEKSNNDYVPIDRSKRTNPYANTPSYAQGGNGSRYSTGQGWSRGHYGYGYGYGYYGHYYGRGSDLASSGYTTPSTGRR